MAVPEFQAFLYTQKEDGESASEWAVIYPYPSGATVTSVTDTDHHPDGTSKVIKCHGGNGNVFGIGDNDAGGWNPNDTAWNCTKRVLSFWYKGGFGPLYVGMTTSAGKRLPSAIPFALARSVATDALLRNESPQRRARRFSGWICSG